MTNSARELASQPGCTKDNNWCDPPEAHVTDTNPAGCDAGAGNAGWLLAVAIAGIVALRKRRRIRALVLASVATIGTAYADDPPAQPTQPTQPATVPADPAHADAPGVPVDPNRACRRRLERAKMRQ